MVQDLHFPIKVVVGATMRERDGLAMSSRNAYLSPTERKSAPVLFQAMIKAQQAFLQGERRRIALIDILDAHLMAKGFKAQYWSIVHQDSLCEVDTVEAGCVLSGAVLVGKTRIIDNIVFKS
jgi:pantoate--beta-alanine ligase